MELTSSIVMQLVLHTAVILLMVYDLLRQRQPERRRAWYVIALEVFLLVNAGYFLVRIVTQLMG